MLLDRSLMAMAISVCVLAIATSCLAVISFRDYLQLKHLNPFTTSVAIDRDSESCNAMDTKSIIVHLAINIFATVLLGVSNTYQQLASGLMADDLKAALRKYGDVTVETNSPFSIKHKQKGKFVALMSWGFFLIATSLPIHLLANSIVGPSFVIEPVDAIYEFGPAGSNYSSNSYASNNYHLFDDGNTVRMDAAACWLTMVTGKFSNVDYDAKFGGFVGYPFAGIGPTKGPTFVYAAPCRL